MSKTALVWLIIFFGGGIVGLVRAPQFALYTYIFTYYTLLTWARGVPHLRYSLIMSTILFVAFIIKKRRLDEISITIPSLKWLLLLLVNMFILTQFADDPVASHDTLFQFLKVIVIYYLIVVVIRTKNVFLIFVWVQLWGNYLFGWQAYSFGDIVGGRLENIGGPGTKESNYLANHFLLILPFLLNFILIGNKWEKMAAIIAIPFIGNAFVQCNSRGSFLGLLVAAGAGLILYKGKKNWAKIAGLLLIVIPIFLQFTPSTVFDRFATIQSYEEDGSSTSRIAMWQGALRMIADHPLGSGGGGFEVNSRVYAPEVVANNEQDMAVHNTYLMLGTDWGVQGLLLWLFFVANTMIILHRIRTTSRSNTEDFFYLYSIAIELGLIGYLAAIFFGNRIYSETFYWYCALAVVLRNIQINSLKINKPKHPDEDFVSSELCKPL